MSDLQHNRCGPAAQILAFWTQMAGPGSVRSVPLGLGDLPAAGGKEYFWNKHEQTTLRTFKESNSDGLQRTSDGFQPKEKNFWKLIVRDSARTACHKNGLCLLSHCSGRT